MFAVGFYEKLTGMWRENRFVCVGLDVDYRKIPEVVKAKAKESWLDAVVLFNQRIVDATLESKSVCAFKPNSAFYEYGEAGMIALERTTEYIRLVAPEVPVILDAKRGDIGNSNYGYAGMAFGWMKADALTISPYLGKEANAPFLDQAEKGIIVLVKTSNDGSGEFQDLELASGEKLYMQVARNVASEWNYNSNVAVVVGATYPEELAAVRGAVGDIPILIPGVGAQGGDLASAVRAGISSTGRGIIVNSSRGIIYASSGEDYAEAAAREAWHMNNVINAVRNELGFYQPSEQQ